MHSNLSNSWLSCWFGSKLWENRTTRDKSFSNTQPSSLSTLKFTQILLSFKGTPSQNRNHWPISHEIVCSSSAHYGHLQVSIQDCLLPLGPNNPLPPSGNSSSSASVKAIKCTSSKPQFTNCFSDWFMYNILSIYRYPLSTYIQIINMGIYMKGHM